jgi:hypothetical protein
MLNIANSVRPCCREELGNYVNQSRNLALKDPRPMYGEALKHSHAVSQLGVELLHERALKPFRNVFNSFSSSFFTPLKGRMYDSN